MRGRPPSAEAVERVAERYRRIGGGSPAPEFARSIARKLECACGHPVYAAMLYWHPLVEEVVSQMAADGISQALVVCLVPHFSHAGVGKYQRRTVAAAESAGLAADLIDSWHASAGYINALAGSIVSAESSRGGGPRPAHVIFTAHSLPKAVMEPDDPYEGQLLETSALVAGRLGLRREEWTLAFQSAVGPRGQWLGPAVQDVVASLASGGTHRVIICPIGFVLDQVETLYDLDVALKEEAEGLGVDLVRVTALNDSDELVGTLARLVRAWAAGAPGGGRA